jgi:hypothetical protein
MAVEYITYKGEKLPIKLGYYALKMMQSEFGVDLTNTSELALYEPLLFYALVQGHKIEKKKLKLKMTDMVDVLDDCFFEFAELIPKFFPEDFMEKMMAGVGENKAKKK